VGTSSAAWTTLVFFLGTPPYHYGSEAAGLFGLIGAGGAAGAPLFGRLADHRGPRFAVGLVLLSVLISFFLMWVAGKILVGLIDAWRLHGWAGVCAFCLIVMLLALAKFAAGRRSAVAAPAVTADWHSP
jgi:predicted MFS family arabinose efflux permease